MSDCLNECVKRHKLAVTTWTLMWCTISILATLLFTNNPREVIREIDSAIDATLSGTPIVDSTSTSDRGGRDGGDVRTRYETVYTTVRDTATYYDTVRVELPADKLGRVYRIEAEQPPEEGGVVCCGSGYGTADLQSVRRY